VPQRSRSARAASARFGAGSSPGRHDRALRPSSAADDHSQVILALLASTGRLSQGMRVSGSQVPSDRMRCHLADTDLAGESRSAARDDPRLRRFDPAPCRMDDPAPPPTACRRDSWKRFARTAVQASREEQRHGAWIPSLHRFPKTGAPVFQGRLPSRSIAGGMLGRPRRCLRSRPSRALAAP
jgi:hypothetical protein